MGTVTTTVAALAQAITRMEGTNPAYAANNNPGNLIYVGQAGATPGAGGFAKFQTYQDGMNALQNQVTLNISNYPGLTLDTFFAGQRDASGNVIPGGYPGYAPAAAGNQPLTTYSVNVASWTGIPTDVPLAQVVSTDSTPAPVDTSTPIDPSTIYDPTTDPTTQPSSGIDLSSLSSLTSGLASDNTLLIAGAVALALLIWAATR
jgi:hypothetical protein